MKKFASTLLLACALLGAGCSGPDEPTVTGPPPTLTPMPDYTQEELAAMKPADGTKAADAQKHQEAALAAMPTAFPALTVVPLEIRMATFAPPTATPTP